MGYSIGYDDRWKRYIGYGVPAYCDHPKCNKEIDRGLSYVCGGEPYGGDNGCGLFFCSDHLDQMGSGLCKRCSDLKGPYKPKPEHPEWMSHVLKDKSWRQWRKEHKEIVEKFKKELEENKK